MIKKHLVLFIDIMGFSSMIEKFELDYNSNKDETILKNIIECIEKAKRIAIQNSIDINKGLEGKLKYKIFSDCICISIPYDETSSEDFYIQLFSMLNIASTFQIVFQMEGYVIRGGLSFGNYYIDDNIIFGKPLVDSYIIERDIIKNFFIGIDNKLIDKIKKTENKTECIFNNHIIKYKNTSIYFINPYSIYTNMNKNLSLIDKLLKKTGLPGLKDFSIKNLFEVDNSEKNKDHIKEVDLMLNKFENNKKNITNIEIFNRYDNAIELLKTFYDKKLLNKIFNILHVN